MYLNVYESHTVVQQKGKTLILTSRTLVPLMLHSKGTCISNLYDAALDHDTDELERCFACRSWCQWCCTQRELVLLTFREILYKQSGCRWYSTQRELVRLTFMVLPSVTKRKAEKDWRDTEMLCKQLWCSQLGSEVPKTVTTSLATTMEDRSLALPLAKINASRDDEP